MAKIWCEECYGTGKQQWQQSSQNIPYDEPCEACKGQGYTEEQMVSVAKVREWADKNNSMDSYQRRMLRLSELRDYLDSMESDKGDKSK